MKLTSLSPAILLTTIALLTGCGGGISGNTQPETVVKENLSRLSEVDISQTGSSHGYFSNIGNNTVEYGLYVPDRDEGELVPLVISLHYAGGTGPEFLYDVIAPSLGELGAFIVSPTAPAGMAWTQQQTQNNVLEIINQAIQNWPVDPQKVVLTGYSLGGHGTWSMTARYPDIFSASIPMATSPKLWMDQLTSDVPLYIIHPEYDAGYPLTEVQGLVEELQERGVDAQFIIASGAEHGDVMTSAQYLYESMDWLKNTVWQ